MSIDELIGHVHARYAQIYLGGIQSTLNKDAAFLSFICTLTAVEALGGFLKPGEKNRPRFKSFILGYFPKAYHAHADALWMLRNAAAHGISPRPYTLTHHNGHLHMTICDHPSTGSIENLYAVFKRPHTQIGIVQSDVLAFVSRVQSNPTLVRIAQKT